MTYLTLLAGIAAYVATVVVIMWLEGPRPAGQRDDEDPSF